MLLILTISPSPSTYVPRFAVAICFFLISQFKNWGSRKWNRDNPENVKMRVPYATQQTAVAKFTHMTLQVQEMSPRLTYVGILWEQVKLVGSCRVAKCHIFYTEQIFQTKFYPTKSVWIATNSTLELNEIKRNGYFKGKSIKYGWFKDKTT